jgi:hypothetical protein
MAGASSIPASTLVAAAVEAAVRAGAPRRTVAAVAAAALSAALAAQALAEMPREPEVVATPSVAQSKKTRRRVRKKDANTTGRESAGQLAEGQWVGGVSCKGPLDAPLCASGLDSLPIPATVAGAIAADHCPEEPVPQKKNLDMKVGLKLRRLENPSVSMKVVRDDRNSTKSWARGWRLEHYDKPGHGSHYTDEQVQNDFVIAD